MPGPARRQRSLVASALAGFAFASLLFAPTSSRADIIRLADMLRGIPMTAAQCAEKPDTVWVTVFERSFCIRYYISSAGGVGTRPIVHLSGDKIGPFDTRTREFAPVPEAGDIDTADLMKRAEMFSRNAKTTAIYLARIGIDGSSGTHTLRRTLIELHAVSAALDQIKARFKFDGFHLVGQSGGAGLVGGLLALRSDIGCAVPGSGGLALLRSRRSAEDPAMAEFDPSDSIAAIARNPTARILVVSDAADAQVTIEHQATFVRKLREAGRKVEHYLVLAYDDRHHDVVPYTAIAVAGCIQHKSEQQIAGDLRHLADMVQERIRHAHDRSPSRGKTGEASGGS